MEGLQRRIWKFRRILAWLDKQSLQFTKFYCRVRWVSLVSVSFQKQRYRTTSTPRYLKLHVDCIYGPICFRYTMGHTNCATFMFSITLAKMDRFHCFTAEEFWYKIYQIFSLTFLRQYGTIRTLNVHCSNIHLYSSYSIQHCCKVRY